MERSELSIRLRALALYRDLLSDPVVEAVCTCLDCLENGWPAQVIAAYGELVSRLYAADPPDMGLHIRRIAEDCETAYLRLLSRGERPPETMERCLTAELEEAGDYLPAFESSPVDLAEACRRRAARVDRYGWGIYARHHMFYLDGEGRVVPVRHPDGVRLEDLIDYRRERGLVLANARALLAGKSAANLLLTGDAGTGKSSTVKAVVNELAPRGLRMIQVQKDRLRLLPLLLDDLAENPLKFILFIDDLSFQKGDDNYSALKAVLEGSVSAKSPNVILCATSNRRHLVKETFSDREGDDVHRGDTMQELLSLSERFGLHVTFQRPGKAAYLRIVRRLAEDRGLDRPDLEALAERFALTRGGRSPRAARQFVDNLAAGNLEITEETPAGQ